MIKINKLNFKYRRQVPLFTELDLNLETPGIVGLLGKNGAGKTSLLKIVAGLTFPTEGSCDVLGFKPRQRRPEFLEELFIIPEDLYVPEINSLQYAEFYAGFYPRFDNDIYLACLKDFEVNTTAKLTNLSHGQKKKALLAFALATQTQLLILDEPTNGLDIPSKAQFRRMLAQYYLKDRLILISTHQVHDIENMLDAVVVIDSGKILLQQSMQAITDRLAFKRQMAEPALGSYIYCERQIGGYLVLQHNLAGDQTEVDLEVLFNAILLHPAAIQTAFQAEV